MGAMDGVGGMQGTNQASMGGGPSQAEVKQDSGGFRSAMASLGKGALEGAASAVPGGRAVSDALRSAPNDLGRDQQDQLDRMFEMQEQSQMYNMQYLELQTQLQEDNREFSTLSNLMKVRHDTAKAAINNMHA